VPPVALVGLFEAACTTRAQHVHNAALYAGLCFRRTLWVHEEINEVDLSRSGEAAHREYNHPQRFECIL
jgi:hypothetical protein